MPAPRRGWLGCSTRVKCKFIAKTVDVNAGDLRYFSGERLVANARFFPGLADDQLSGLVCACLGARPWER